MQDRRHPPSATAAVLVALVALAAATAAAAHPADPPRATSDPAAMHAGAGTPAATAPHHGANADVDGDVAAGGSMPVEGFMELAGEVVVDATGGVTAHALRAADQVPADVRAFLDRQVARWRVEFDAGVAPPAGPVPFRARVRASPAGDGRYGLWLDGVELEEVLPPGQQLQATHRSVPDYPRAMARIGASGVVYMLVLVGADGRVRDVFAEQVDLTVVPADPADFAQYQLEFMASAATAARRWRFRMPSDGPYAGDGPQALRIPFVFHMHHRPMAAYGQWDYRVRGVRRPPPWPSVVDPEAGRAMASADLQPARPRMRVVAGDDGRGG